MAWIRIVEESEAGDALRKVYQQVVGSRGKIANILAVHSLHQPTLECEKQRNQGNAFDVDTRTR